MTSYTYLIIDLGCFIIPFIFSFYYKYPFYKEWKSFFKSNILIALGFVFWDFHFTHKGIWGFNTNYLTGMYVGNLPIEEILFFISIPYACVFTFFALKHLLKNNLLNKIETQISDLLILGLLITAILNVEKTYTFCTFSFNVLLLLFFKFKKINLSYHYLTYLLILPFFYLSNGLLTGSFLIEPIVWYNDLENLGIRWSNIPIEDAFYALLLIFSNIELYQYFKKQDVEKTI